MSRRFSILSMLFAGALATAGSPAAASDAPPEALSRIDRWLAPAAPGGFRAELVRLLDGTGDPVEAAGGAVTRSLLEAAGLGDLPVNGEDDSMFGESILVGAGDLDGDGAEDALEYRFTYDDAYDVRTTVSAVRGTDGAMLWSRDLGGFGVLIPAGDLDGQGGDDLLGMEVSFDEVPGAFLWTLEYSGVRGADAAVLWSRSEQNPWTFVGAGTTGAYLDINFAIPFDLADVNGDGAIDLLLAHYEVLFAWDDATGVADGGVAALFEFVSGRTGAAVSAFPGAARLAFPDAAVIPDLSGDDRPDIAVLSYNRTASGGIDGSIIAYPGSGGAPRWRSPVQQQDIPFLRGMELTGDGLGDVLLQTVVFDFEDHFSFGPTTFEARSGADGASLWAAEFPGFTFAVAAGDATGDGGEDLLVFPDVFGFFFFVEEEVEAGSRSASGPDGGPAPELGAALLLDGADGSTVWSHESDGFAFADVGGDLTGDGVGDALVTSFELTYNEELDELFFTSVTKALSGVDGSVAWSRPAEEDSFLWPLRTDLDGDGSEDLVRIEYLWETDSEAYAGVSGADGQDLWPGVVDTGGYLLYLDTAALRGGPGVDILESGFAFSEGSAGDYTAARSGADGSLLWRRVPVGPA